MDAPAGRPRPPGDEPVDGSRPDDAGDAAGGRAGRRAFLLRLPADLHEELRRWAADDLRSLNGQIEFLLREAVRRRR